MRVLFSGGGTGGHLYPTLSLALALLRGGEGRCRPISLHTAMGRSEETADSKPALHAIVFVGAAGNIDEQLLTRDAVPYKVVPARPMAGVHGIKTVISAGFNAVALVQALRIVAHFRPDVIVGSGGYACAPAVVAGAVLRSFMIPRVRIILLEPNVVPGIANQRLVRYADEVWGGYPDSPVAQHFGEKFVNTGIPVRAELAAPLSKEQARRSLGLDPAGFTVLVFGGSQGARSLNSAVSGMVARRRLPGSWQVLHVTGERDYAWMLAERKADANGNRYVLEAYLDNMALAYRAADIAVCRSGASTLAEIAAVGLPALLVPYPLAAEDHQRKNADYFVDRGAAFTLSDATLTADSLYWILVDIAEPAKLGSLSEKVRRLAHPHAVDAMLQRLLGRSFEKGQLLAAAKSASHP